MLNIHNKTDQELTFIAGDCFDAVRAFPQGHKAMQYLQDAKACQDELDKRERLRIVRAALRGAHLGHVLTDRLLIPIKHRRRLCLNCSYAIDQFKSACFQVGWYRLYNLI